MSKTLSDFKLLSFDVYGTLIDWETGVLNALTPITSQISMTREQILTLYHDLEKKQQFASQAGLPAPTAQEAEKFGNSVGSWPAFPDTVGALRRLGKLYKMAVLSNVDRRSFQASVEGPLEGFRFDKVLTAQDIGSYKPDLSNFEYMLKNVESEFGLAKEDILQTAQSQFHDHRPAKEMGIKSVWIERGGKMGNLDGPIYDWRFVALGNMADAVEYEHEHGKGS